MNICEYFCCVITIPNTLRHTVSFLGQGTKIRRDTPARYTFQASYTFAPMVRNDYR
jgi:hypothetical protein